MKVAVLVNELTVRGGTHKQVLRLCEYLEHEGINFVLCTRSYTPQMTYPEFSKYNPLFLYQEEQKWKGSSSVFRTIQHVLWNRNEDNRLYNLIPKDVDIINVHDNFLDGIIRRAKKDGKKVVWQINDLDPVFRVGVSNNKENTFRNRIKRLFYKRNIRNVDEITVNVTKNAERVKKCLNKDAKVFYCGVDFNSGLEKHFYKEKEEFRILSMGVFFSYRNYETLIDVIKQLNDDGYNVRLDIIGKTDYDISYTHSIQTLIQRTQLSLKVKIWGQVDEKVYNTLFNKADAFAFINIEQSWGLAVFEAMSAGLPTIVSNSVGAVELLHNGEDSIIVDPKNVDEICKVIKKLFSNNEYYNAISNGAARIVKEYTWERLYSSRMLDVFKELDNKK